MEINGLKIHLSDYELNKASQIKAFYNNEFETDTPYIYGGFHNLFRERIIKNEKVVDLLHKYQVRDVLANLLLTPKCSIACEDAMLVLAEVENRLDEFLSGSIIILPELQNLLNLQKELKEMTYLKHIKTDKYKELRERYIK